MKNKGSTEENDPEYARLITLLKYYGQFYNRGAKPALSVDSTSSSALSENQMSTLRYQVAAFKLLAANKPLSDKLQDILFSNSPDSSDPLASKVVDVTMSSIVDPYTLLSKARPGTSDVKQRLIIPSIMPQVPDPDSLKKERERFLNARIQYRIKELESLPSNVSNEGSTKLKALIELKSLKLLEKQKKLRSDILNSISKATTLVTAVDRSSFRRMKRQSLREARQTEKQERSNRVERDKKERQKHLDYLSFVLMHGRDMVSFHRQAASKTARMNSLVNKFHVNTAKEEERRLQQVSQERLRALKENDEEAYLKLIDKTKDKRITHLLSQTDSFLKSLTNAVAVQKRSVGDDFVDTTVAPAPVVDSLEPKDEEAEILDYYNTAHKVKEEVTEQASILVGGKLKEYQVKGLQWMVSLYNNRLNGILADEMVFFVNFMKFECKF